jgi:hypothetical protein
MSVEAPAKEGLPRLLHGLKVWYAVVGGIGAWTVHMLFLSSFVQYTCNEGHVGWVHHVVTAVTAAATVLSMVLAWSLVREGADADEAAPSYEGRTRFLGMAGLLIGAINLALILLEGSYVFFLKPCA